MDRSMNRNQNADFEQRLVALYPQLVRMAFKLCRNSADARDLAQNAMEKGLRNRASFVTGDSPDRWMCTILRRMFLDGCRVRRRRARIALPGQLDATPPPDTDGPPAWETFTIEEVQRALLFCDRESREIYNLFEFDSLPQEEIARRMSISRKTVATRVFRTRAKLRTLLESGEYSRQLVLVSTAPEPPPAPPPPARVPAHPRRTRVSPGRRPRQATAASRG